MSGDAHHGTDAPALAQTLADGTRTLADSDAVQELAGSLKPGDRIDGFVIEGPLGAGAMGVVLLARDQDLGRRVAIKLLASGHHEDDRAHKRMLREAQSVAQVQHPNVVALHQVGVHQGSVYLVMEYVDGGTLREWREAKSRSWPEILDVYRQAGAGLAAAHAAGLVHRDFKPDNALIGSDGRVRVSDFGLVGARVTDDTMPNLSVGDVRLTQTGAMMGTPAYMAPEQFVGAEVGAAADQFALCVALYEALFGQRPFAGGNPGALLVAIEEGELRQPPRGHTVPPGVLRAIVRGLCSAPESRHACVSTLVELISTSRHSPQRRTRPWMAAAAVATVLLGIGVWTTRAPTQPATDQDVALPCPAADEPIPAWSPSRQDALRVALAGAGLPDATATADRAVAAAVERSVTLATLRHDACVAQTPVRDPETRAQMRACVSQRIFEFAMTVDFLLEAPSTDVALSSAVLLRDAPPAESCLVVGNVEHRVFAAASTSEAQGARQQKIWRARLLSHVGAYTAAARLAQEVLTAPGEPAPQAVLSDANLLAATEPFVRGDTRTAQTYLRAASTAARAAGDAMRETVSLVELMNVLTASGQTDQALALAEQAGAAAANAGPDAAWRLHLALAQTRSRAGLLEQAEASASLALDSLQHFAHARPRAQVSAHETLAEILRAQKEYSRACQEYQAALNASAPFGVQHPRRAKILSAYGETLGLAGDIAGARQRFDEALAILKAASGDQRTPTASVFFAIGELERTQQNLDLAADALTTAARLFGTAGRGQERVAQALTELGIVEFMRGRNDAADVALIRAAKIALAHPNSTVIDVARIEGMAGGVAVTKGRLADGLAHHQRVLEHYELRYGPSTPIVVRTHVNLGDIAMYMRECGLARGSYRRALRIRTDLGLPRDQEVMRIVTGQALCDAIDGNLDDARDGLRRIEQDIRDGNVAPWRDGRLDMLRAELALRQGDIANARRHAKAARAKYAELGPGHQLDVDHMDRWLAALAKGTLQAATAAIIP